jgi:hypothetical protein
VDHTERLSILERLARVEARVRIAAEVVDSPASNVELAALVGELQDVVADFVEHLETVGRTGRD